MFTTAICRTPGPDFAQGITTSTLGAPDFDRMLVQHGAYVEALRRLGLVVTVKPALPGHPDAYFVEDSAVVTPGLAVISRPGAAARRGEEDAMAPVLAGFKPTARIQAPGTLDGGDVLIVERIVFVGLTERTNAEGAAQLGRLLEPQGFTTVAVPVAAGLHLKSSVNTLGGRRLLITRGLAEQPAFRDHERIVVDEGEEYASNVLWINGTLLVPSGYPGTRARLDALGLPVVELDTSEARRMDGGLTCLSIRF